MKMKTKIIAAATRQRPRKRSSRAVISRSAIASLQGIIIPPAGVAKITQSKNLSRTAPRSSRQSSREPGSAGDKTHRIPCLPVGERNLARLRRVRGLSARPHAVVKLEWDKSVMCINDYRHAVYVTPPELARNALRCLLFRNNQRRSSHARAVLIFDEAQEMLPAVLAEMRLLSSARLDSQTRSQPGLQCAICASKQTTRRERRRLPQPRPRQSCETGDGDSIVPHFAKHRFATHSAERAIFLKRIDDAVRKYP
jgi:hypothetical protein